MSNNNFRFSSAKVCTHCGSGISPAIAPTPHRLTLSPDLAEICANLLKDQFSDLESRYMINTAFGLTQNSNSLRRCQTFAAIQVSYWIIYFYPRHKVYFTLSFVIYERE